MASLFYEDLVGLEWEAGVSDCMDACAEVLRRLRMEEAAAALMACRATGRVGAGWRPVEEPSVLGDILLSRSGDGGLHVSVLCDTDLRLALSSASGHGVHVIRADRVQSLVGVYRYAG